MDELSRSLSAFRPELALLIGLALVVLADTFLGASRQFWTRLLTAASLAGALGAALALAASGTRGTIFSGMLVIDPLGSALELILIASGLLTVLAFSFRNSRELHGLGQGELYSLVLALVLSCLLLAAAGDVVMLYLALEMVSITSYVMVAYLKGDRLSNEASLKYVLFGAASTGSMLYGLSLLYGLSGTTSLRGIQEYLAGGIPDGNRFAVYAITLLVLAGFGFKIAAVPFHFWCPDVYQGAATPVTALLSVLPKAAGLAIALRFFYGTFSVPGRHAWDLSGSIEWGGLLMLVSVLTMTLGNVAALTQTNMKRLLAYSSIAHAGYILMALETGTPKGREAALFYLFAYAFMVIGSFAVVTVLSTRGDEDHPIEGLRGLGARRPVVGGLLVLFMLAQAGIPLTSGFVAKLDVFSATAQAGDYVLVVIGTVATVIAAFAYLRVALAIASTTGDGEVTERAVRRRVDVGTWIVLAVTGTVTVVLGIVPAVFVHWARDAIVLTHVITWIR